MAKHEAVDRLMALATEKRADRIPQIETTPEVFSRVVPPLPPEEAAGEAPAPVALAAAAPTPASLAQGGQRGKQLWNTVRPMLPALAGAMRLVDHGAVQALARLLPLLGGGAALFSPADAPPTAANPAQEQTARQLAAFESLLSAKSKAVDALTFRCAELEGEMLRTRTQLERLVADEAARAHEIRGLADRARLLTASTIILLMLVVAQMILLVVIFHR